MGPHGEGLRYLRVSDLTPINGAAQTYFDGPEMNKTLIEFDRGNTTDLHSPPEVDRLIVGNTPIMEHIKRQIAVIGRSNAPVLVQGETGTGKELVAEALHAASGRTGELVAVNCAAIPSELLESELFGHEKGAFTGADSRKIGRFEQANGGTLFLDEIGDMPPSLQVKLLRVLESRRVRRLGSMNEVDVDFRLVTATHRDLASGHEVEFREDLFFRVAVFQLTLPSLSDRVTDIPLIMERMLRDIQDRDGDIDIPHFDQTAIRALSAHPWRGNVRELRNMMVRATVLFPGQMITGEMVRNYLLCAGLPEFVQAGTEMPAPLPEAQGLPNPDQFRNIGEAGQDLDIRIYLRDIEIALIESALERTAGCVSKAADALRLRRTTLIEKMKKYGLQRA